MPDGTINVVINQEFEECLDLTWADPHCKHDFKEFVVEMVLDRSSGKQAGPLQPPKDAMVKRVSMGLERSACIQNMPEGRKFLVSVVGKLAQGKTVRSEWIRATTLRPEDREKDLENLDPMSVPRMNCMRCPCARYVPLRFEMNTPEKMRCRRCGDHYTDHVAVEVSEILKARESRFCRQSRKETVKPLPSEALEWDNRECALWFCSEGAVHPRRTVGEYQRAVPEDAKTMPGGPHGIAGRKGRVSVVTPTTESRHKFHELLWRCFEAQTWPDKELVVVETYQDHHSAFFDRIAQQDDRLIYIKFKRSKEADWSIGLKRNIGAHLATGEFIANFDDDDLYAPAFLVTMVGRLKERNVHAIKLSSWFTYTTTTADWGFCDPIAWGLTKGMDEESRDVKKWVYGYGFSYVFLRQTGMEMWYEDINLGEDFNFITQLQIRKGDKSVELFHDDFGICLHVQHGGNTSNSIPLRKVARSEALDLDIMELSAHMARLNSNTIAPAGGLLSIMEPPSQRSRRVLAHTPHGDVTVTCAISATTAEFLVRLSDAAGVNDCQGLLVHRVPPRSAQTFDDAVSEAHEEYRDKVAADVLGIAFLAALDGASENLRPESKSGKQWRKLLEQAKRPMHRQDRIGLRTDELWVVAPDPNVAAEEEEEAEEAEEPFMTVKVTCQKSNVKQFFSASHAFSVRLPMNASVATMREVLGTYLPPKAKILAQRSGKDLITLQEADALPDEVTVSDFRGNRGLYMLFTRRQCEIALSMEKDFFRQPSVQQILDVMQEQCKGEWEFRAALVKMLSDEVYPSIFKRLNVPLEEMSPKFFLDAMTIVSHDWELSELWFEVELLMRNRQGLESAWRSVNEHRARHGIPLLAGD